MTDTTLDPKNRLLLEEGHIERIAVLTPDFAGELLKQLHPHQRRLRQHHVEALARAMKEGRWRWTGDSFKFDKDLRVIDGQHRLAAIVLSKVPMRDAIFVVISSDEDTLPYLDQGLVRTIADVRKTLGQPSLDISLSAAICAEHLNWADWHGVSREERLRLYDEFPFHPELQRLRKVCSKMPKVWNAGPLSGAIRCIRKNREAAAEFFVATFSGSFKVYDTKACPASRLLHQTLMRRRAYASAGSGSALEDTRATAVRTIRAYNAWRDCFEPEYLRYTQGAPIPEVRP